MDESAKEFYALLKRGPAFLLLGQGYLALETDQDSFLLDTVRKYGDADDAVGYHRILDGDAAEIGDPAFAWMDERCRRYSIPEWLNIVASVPWSGLYLSAIDSVWPNAFRSSWRDVQPILQEKYNPIDPRNRTMLHATLLFGSVNGAEESDRPPLTGFQWKKRRQVAVALARRLPELVTPMGVLAIEGYAGAADWFAPEDLLPIVDDLAQGQTHVFSASPELLENRDVRELQAQGKLILHERGLAETILNGQKSGLVIVGRPPAEEESSRSISFKNEPIAVPREIWNQTTRSALILDDTVLTAPRPVSGDAKYRDFREFLADSGGRPKWEAIQRGFVFRRHFADKLAELVEERLASKKLFDDPIILHGQTGTGKTVSLGALALEIYRRGKYAVLYIERRTGRPIGSDIDRFCQWAEDVGAAASLLIWDGMTGQEEYVDLLRYLTSRGRKVILVGSCYRMSVRHSSGKRFVEASATLSQDEVAGMARFLISLDPSFDKAIASLKSDLDATFLVALYRLLPPTRGRLREGVSWEAIHAESEISAKVSADLTKFAPQTALAYALVTAGLVTEQQLLGQGPVDVGGEEVSGMKDLTGLVMVPGRFGLRVPLEILLRAIGRDGYMRFADVFEGVDIFRWYEDSAGNIEIGPRNSLEAEMLVQARMGGAKTEVAYGRRLILETSTSPDFAQEGRDVRFTVALTRAMGSGGHHRTYFEPFFKELSDTLAELREERGVENPRLMLQEANLRREWALSQNRAGAIGSEDTKLALENVEKVLKKALTSFDEDDKSRHMRAALYVELASAIGAKAHQSMAEVSEMPETTQFFEEARAALLAARRLDPSNYYPVDVLAWTTRDVLVRNALVGPPRVEAVADVIFAFESIDPDQLDSEQWERFNSRRLEFADIEGLDEVADDAFEALSDAGSGAGYYIRALRMTGWTRRARDDREIDLGRISDALAYLEEHRDRVSRDGRCMNLLLNLWWLAKTGEKPFGRERATPGLSNDQWRELAQIVADIESTEGAMMPAELAFLRGLSLFHLGEIGQALTVFREVERLSDRVRGRRRIVRSYLVSDTAGQPKRFNGTVAWISDNANKGEVYVEELRHRIPFAARDFGRQDLQKGDTLGQFHIAFNFLGPLADAPGYFKG